MAKTEDDGDIGAEVSSRLDELFGEDDGGDPPGGEAKAAEATPKEPAKKTTGLTVTASSDLDDSPVKELKGLVFGIDWEITDENMTAFLKEVKRLQKVHAGDQILSMFLKLHESIGKYIKAKKAKAHPDAIKFVISVFKSFEKVLTTEGMDELQKKRILAGEIKKFKEFKERVLSGEPAVAAARPAAPPAAEAVKPAPPAASLQDTDALAEYIIGEVKKIIQEEFRKLSHILKSLGA